MVVILKNINRTFMELKQKLSCADSNQRQNINRTFMELKLDMITLKHLIQ